MGRRPVPAAAEALREGREKDREGGTREEERVDPVVEAAMAGKEDARVLDAGAALPERLDEITDLPGARREGARERAAGGSELRQDLPGARRRSDERRADEAADPSQVFFGDTTGASLCRPKARPP